MQPGRHHNLDPQVPEGEDKMYSTKDLTSCRDRVGRSYVLGAASCHCHVSTLNMRREVKHGGGCPAWEDPDQKKEREFRAYQTNLLITCKHINHYSVGSNSSYDDRRICWHCSGVISRLQWLCKPLGNSSSWLAFIPIYGIGRETTAVLIRSMYIVMQDPGLQSNYFVVWYCYTIRSR